MIHAARTFLVSFELLLLLCVVFVAVWCPSLFVVLDAFIGKLESWIWSTPLIGAVALSFGLSWKILFPVDGARALAQFPRYSEFRTTVVAGVVWVVVAVVAIAVGKAGIGTFEPGYASCIIVSGAGILAVSLFHQFLAALFIRGLMLENDVEN